MLVDLKKTTLVDYPDHLACTLYTWGCNFLCPFCHNKSLIPLPPTGLTHTLTEKDRHFLDTIQARVHLIEGVVITGGEPTLHPALFELTHELHHMGLKVKLDTNGSTPHILERLIKERCVDYIAMDVKDTLNNYPQSIGKHIASHQIEASIHLIQEAYRAHCIQAEFRTTLVSPLHTMETLHTIAQTIEGEIPWYLQCYEYSTQQLHHERFQPLNKEVLISQLEALKVLTPHIFLRGYS